MKALIQFDHIDGCIAYMDASHSWVDEDNGDKVIVSANVLARGPSTEELCKFFRQVYALGRRDGKREQRVAIGLYLANETP